MNDEQIMELRTLLEEAIEILDAEMEKAPTRQKADLCNRLTDILDEVKELEE